MCTASPSVSPTPRTGGPSRAQATASGAGTPSRRDQRFLLTFRPDSIHNYEKRKEAPDFSVLTKNHGFLHDLVCEGSVLPASFRAGLTSRRVYREMENTRFLLKSVGSDKFHDCVLLPHAPPLLRKPQTGLATWLRQQGSSQPSFSPSIRELISSPPKDRFSHYR